jgi:hypothetical protein
MTDDEEDRAEYDAFMLELFKEAHSHVHEVYDFLKSQSSGPFIGMLTCMMTAAAMYSSPIWHDNKGYCWTKEQMVEAFSKMLDMKLESYGK